MIRRPPRSTQSRSSAASDVYKRQLLLTNDGDLASKLLAPKSHVPKTYHVKLMGQISAKALQALRDEGRYRVFCDIRRDRGQFPAARRFTRGSSQPVTVWCSNDYLGMGQHPAVLAAMHTALDAAGAGSGGTRNISGTCLLYTSPSPRDRQKSRMPSSA